jgi:hypothetical protein
MHGGMPENIAFSWQGCAPNRVNAPLTHSERINHRVFVILPVAGAKERNFLKAARRAAPQNQGFERDIYLYTYSPFCKTNPIF